MEVKDLTIGGLFFLAMGFFYYIFQESLKVLLQKEVKKFEQEFNGKLEQFKAKEIQLNLEVSQYLQIVTTQRIKWLELIREDLSSIISSSGTLYFHNNVIISAVQVCTDSMTKGHSGTFSEVFKGDSKAADLFFESMKSKETILGTLLGQIAKFKLRLNPNEDASLIKNLELLEQELLKETKREEIDKILKAITLQCQVMLKTEWEKVKSEVKYGDRLRADVPTSLSSDVRS